MRKVGTLVIWTISLIWYASISPVDKGVLTIEVAVVVSGCVNTLYLL